MIVTKQPMTHLAAGLEMQSTDSELILIDWRGGYLEMYPLEALLGCKGIERHWIPFYSNLTRKNLIPSNSLLTKQAFERGQYIFNFTYHVEKTWTFSSNIYTDRLSALMTTHVPLNCKYILPAARGSKGSHMLTCSSSETGAVFFFTLENAVTQP